MKKLYLALAIVLTMAAIQPVHAEEAVGQMIDDSGLVISSYADGTIKEFTISKIELASLKILQPNNQLSHFVLQNSELLVSTSK